MALPFFYSYCMLLSLACCTTLYAIGTKNDEFNFEHSREKNMREISIKITVPDPAWSVSIREVYIVDKELWVISELIREPVMAGQIITTTTDKVTLKAPLLPIKHYVLGKTWKWKNEENIVFPNSRKIIDQHLLKAKKIFEKRDKSGDK